MKADIVVALNPSRGAWPVIAAFVLGVGLELVAGCTTFQAADVLADGAGADAASDATADGGEAGGGGDAAPPDRGIRCGLGRCPSPNVCCYDADAGTESCTAKAKCPSVPLECTTTVECADAGAPKGSVCCAYNNGKDRLLRSECVQPSACDASGPQDWLCDPKLAAGTECTESARPKCKTFLFPVPVGFAYCGM
jgi:hypothetical protein